MGLYTTVGKPVLAVLCVAGVAGILKFSIYNGLLGLMEKGIASKRLPDSRTTMRTYWTGIKLVDFGFSVLITIFSTVLDGRHPGVMLQGFHFLGQLSGLWTIMVLESLRVGNAWKPIAFITLWGLAMEFASTAIVTPLYFLLHLFTSPSASHSSSSKASSRVTGFLVHPASLKTLPWSIAIGFGVPTFMMAYCDEAVIQPWYLSRQFWILARLFHPIWTAVVDRVLSRLSSVADPGFASAEQRNGEVLRSLSNVYAFAKYQAIVLHVATMTPIVLTQIAPGLLATKYQMLLRPYTVYGPTHFLVNPTIKASSIGSGVGTFLQWDELIPSIAVVVWAMVLNREALSNASKGSNWLSMLFKTALLVAIGGPTTAAISLIQERDQIILESQTVTSIKKTN